jgi:hypothetical protein
MLEEACCIFIESVLFEKCWCFSCFHSPWTTLPHHVSLQPIMSISASRHLLCFHLCGDCIKRNRTFNYAARIRLTIRVQDSDDDGCVSNILEIVTIIYDRVRSHPDA